MSIRALNWVFSPAITEREEITASMRHILVVLANYASVEDETYPRQSTIARVTGLTRSTVNLQLSRLVSIGVISMTGRTHDNGAKRSSEYKLHIPAEADVLAEDERPTPRKGDVGNSNMGDVRNSNMGSSNIEQGMSANQTGDVRSSDILNPFLEPNQEPNPKHKQPAARKTTTWPADYREQFWKIYPKKKGDSRKEAWRKLDIVYREDEVEFADIMKGLGFYAERMNAEVKKDASNMKYIAAASVWINQARWETESAPGKDDGPKPKFRFAI
jgi:hypothetical protein